MNNKKITIPIILLPLILVSLSILHSCKKAENEGVIEYKITFDEEERKQNEIIELLPNTMKFYFKNHSSVSEISYMGVFKTAYIRNTPLKTNSILFYFLPNSYYCSTQFGQETIGYDPMPGIQIEETKETKDIMGFTAKKAIITFKNKTIPAYDIWYTDDIRLHNPNWHTPYKTIKGVLLDYRIKMKGISMHMTINKFTKSVVDTAKFIIPTGYKKVSPIEMDTIFNKHLHMF